MTHSPLMYGLIKLHSRLEGDLNEQKENLAHVRAVIKIVDPDFDVYSIPPKRTNKVNPFFKKGEAFLLALEVLREAKEPMEAVQIAVAILAKKGFLNPSAADRRSTWNSVKNTMDRYDGNVVVSIGRPKARRWSIKNLGAISTLGASDHERGT